MQMRVMKYGEKAPELSATANISAFNIANALGGVIGAIVVDGSLGPAAIPYAATFIPVLGDRQGRPGPGCTRPPRCLSIGRAARFGISQRGIGQALRRLGVTYKKTLSSPKASKDGRRFFRARIKAHEAEGWPIVSIDESGFANDMPRTQRTF